MSIWVFRALSAVGLLCLAPCAGAAEVTPVNVPCGPLDGMADAGKYRRLTHNEWEAARAIFFMAPDTPAALPPGDAALIYERPDGSATLVFLDNDEACAPMRIGKDSVKLLAQIGAGVVTHPPGRL